jgi:multiple sugar transport system substrate-binding protein
LIRTASGWSEEEFLEKIDFTPIPAGPNGHRATVLGGLSYAVYRQSKLPDLAFELIARANRPEVLIQYCRRTGQNPPTISGAQALAAETEPYLHATAHLFDYAKSRWSIPEYTRVAFQFRRMFESAIRGEIEPAAAVARAATVIAGITGLPERGAPRRSQTH